MSVKYVVLVGGTHSWDGTKEDWPCKGQPFYEFVCRVPGYELLCPDDPYVWSTRLGGIGFGDDDLLIYRAGGINLRQHVNPTRCPEKSIPSQDLIVITHSHGLQVALCAAESGLRIGLLIDVCGPVRNDMMKIAEKAVPNIRRWVHIHAGKKDRMQWLGALFDGHVGVQRKHPLAENLARPESDHGMILRDPLYFELIRGIMEGMIYGEQPKRTPAIAK